MREQFIKYLIERGYKQTTPSGLPSTAYDYANRIDMVCKDERLTMIELAQNIAAIVDKYDVGGAKEHIGARSHRAVINSLKRFNEFVQDIDLI